MRITIIYNPNSTGDSEANARAAREQLEVHDVTLIATDFAGHAEELARSITENDEADMIISSSGDGGYHEVINGILSTDEHSRMIVGLLPSGNANDHYNYVHEGDLVSRIAQNDIRPIDVLQLENGKFNRFAHSYIGFGLTPEVGEELNRTRLNWLNEKWIVVKHFFTHYSVRIRFNGQSHRYRSLIFSNIARMAKVLTLADDARVDDGLLEVTATPSHSIFSLLRHLTKAALFTLDGNTKRESVEFSLRKSSLVQLDGEVYQLDSAHPVTIRVRQRALRCII